MGLRSRRLYAQIFTALLLAHSSSPAKGQESSHPLGEPVTASGVTATHLKVCTGPSWARCGAKQLCRNLAVDPFNCGSCGTFCGLGGFCRSGACTCRKQGLTFCPGKGCRSTSSDTANCGACGKACVAGQTCVKGQCGCKSGPFQFLPGQALCRSSQYQKSCVNIASDNKNCGRCGKVCSAGLTCCAGLCTDTTTNANCGACGRACTGTDTCQGGTCAPSCIATGAGTCTDAADCCSGLVECSANSICCNGPGAPCQIDDDCCDGIGCGGTTCVCFPAAATVHRLLPNNSPSRALGGSPDDVVHKLWESVPLRDLRVGDAVECLIPPVPEWLQGAKQGTEGTAAAASDPGTLGSCQVYDWKAVETRLAAIALTYLKPDGSKGVVKVRDEEELKWSFRAENILRCEC